MRICLPLVAAVALTAPCFAGEGPYPPLPTGVSSFGTAVEGGYLYVYGGHTGTTHTYSTETASGKFRRLDLANPAKGWEELARGTPLQGLALVAHAGKIYRIGGMQPLNKPGEKADNRSTKSCSVYTPATGRWAPIADMPAGRSSHDAAVVGDLLVVIGGWDMLGAGRDDLWHDTALILDLSQKNPTWTTIAQPFKRRALNLAAIGDKAYAIGGMSWENEIDKSVDVLDLKSRTWSHGPTLPGPTLNGFSAAACTIGDSIFASPADGKIYRLAGKRDAWAQVGTLRDKRLVHRLVAVGDRLLVIGGAAKKGNHADIEVIKPSPVEKSATIAKAGEQVFCPIMTTSPIDADCPTVEYKGVKIRVCCANCLKRWKAEPEAYLNVELLPQLKGIELPARKLEQIRCPVYPERVVSSKDPSTAYRGMTIHFFNETAKARFLADPAKYAK